MLRGLRKASSNWLGKTVMAAVVGFLIVSFAIWGIGDIFRGFGRSTVAKIGSTEITIEQFRQIYNDRAAAAQPPVRPADHARAGPRARLRPAGARPDRRRGRARRARAPAAASASSDAEIAKRITDRSGVPGPNGQFDRVRFEQMIRQAGFTEPRFVAEQRRRLLRRQLAETVGGRTQPAARPGRRRSNRYRNEQRSIEYVLLDRAKAGEIPTPRPRRRWRSISKSARSCSARPSTARSRCWR